MGSTRTTHAAILAVIAALLTSTANADSGNIYATANVGIGLRF